MTYQIFVTGAGGYIGEHLVRALYESNISHGAAYRRQPSGISDLTNVVVVDLLDTEALATALCETAVVVHLGGKTGPGQSDVPSEFVRQNVETTASVLRAATIAGVKRVVLSSSYEVYGRPSSIPIRETDSCVPSSVYGATMLGRELLASVWQTDDLDVTVLRFFNVFGEPLSERNRKGVIQSVLGLARKGTPPTFAGSGNIQRDFVHVSDVTRCILLASSLERKSNITVNVGSGKGTSLLDLAGHLRSSFPDLDPDMSKIEYDGAEKHFVAQAELAQSTFGFTASYGVERAFDQV